ncbi:hypothetical protein III_05741 [Bacillus mycoides]|uniref:Uncharacterized protein n=1 Tax=Bacillus mycoides TaxID=1405 RepID=A0ABC9QV01_BACMY|nr:hypothetical protein III_05741 [Bacillus mycoides]
MKGVDVVYVFIYEKIAKPVLMVKNQRSTWPLPYVH